jgi:hypothetical protein
VGSGRVLAMYAALQARLKNFGTQLKAYERHISALAMLGGFGFDSLSYGRVDHAVTQTLLLVYIAVAAGTIVLLHYLESHPQWQGKFTVRLRGLLPAATQFAFGSLWSAFLVFYARGGTVDASWPFLLILLAIFIGNEVLKAYHARLIFTSVLLAFALLSYAIFMVPVFVHSIGVEVFVLSGIAAALVFFGFLWAIGKLGRERWREVKFKALAGAFGIFAVVYGLYFSELLPPLPLAMQKIGVFNSLKHQGAVYYATGEPQSWKTWLGVPPVVHIEQGDQVFVFSAVFAPVKLETRVRHVWKRYDAARGQWLLVQSPSYEIIGGREKGYRGFTRKTSPVPGLWRVDVDTVDGRLIGRVQFTVERSKPPAAPTTTEIK